MGKNARLLLRRIALGLPIAVAPLGGFVLLTSACVCGGGNCGQPFATTTHPIDSAQHDRLFSTGMLDPTACRALCLELDVSGPDDGGIDAGGGDAGLAAAPYSGVTCVADNPTGTQETLTCTYTTRCIGGRAPAGLAEARGPFEGVGGWLARAAHLEQASVPAFEDLARELAMHDAPAPLVRAALRSADDERRHARLVGALARRRGVAVPHVVRTASAPRALRAMAEDNAVEGCVREAYAALVAAHQAHHAADADVRAVYTRVASDEARHALLSSAIHRWALARLGARAAAQIEARRELELDAWRAAALDAEPIRAALGLPDARTHAALVATLA